MTVSSDADLYYDPFNTEIDKDPYPLWKRLREEAPLYYNEKHDFFALSRFDDVDKAMMNWDAYRSGRGSTLEIIKANITLPPGIILMEDPPIHDLHRGLLSRVFTPKKMNALEPKVREFCARSLDPLVGSGGFDFMADGGEMFADYVEWRAQHPSDDLMTELLNAEFEDETGTSRRLSREEILTYIMLLAGAGNETTTRLIGWAGKLLAEHPDQRRSLVEDRNLLPQAIEEILRFEAPSPVQARTVSRDVEHYGQVVAQGSVMVLLNGSANRDDRQFEDAERFDIRREISHHLSFGYGIHFCLGAALARLEGRVAIDEVLNRFPEWSVDWSGAVQAHTPTVRGWEKLPVVTP